MTAKELLVKLRKNVPANYFYIARTPYSVKGIQVYSIFFNTRIPNTRISTSTIAHQDVFNTIGLQNNKLRRFRTERPMLLDEYTKSIIPNSIFNFIDLAGEFLTHEKTL